MIWVILILVVLIIFIVIISSSRTSNTSDNLDQIFYRNKNYEYIIDIVAKCGYKKPVKLSEFLIALGEPQRQYDLYNYITSQKFKDEYYFFDVMELLTNGQNDLILSVNENKIKADNNYSDNPVIEDLLFDLEEFTDSDDSLELTIRGINFRDLNYNNVGVFDGYIMPDKNNEYDQYAIGVYRNDGVHFGFIEKGQKDLYNLIESGEGYINATLNVTTFVDDMGETKFNGAVTINKNDIV